MEETVEVYRLLEAEIQSMALHRPMRFERYEAGTELEYMVTGVDDAKQAKVRLKIEKFVGGGFAGQVYRVRVLEIDSADGFAGKLQVGYRAVIAQANAELAFELLDDD